MGRIESIITAEEWQLVSFFESEPVLAYPDVPWPYTRAEFVSQSEGAIVRCTIHPSCNDVTVDIQHADFKFTFSALALRDIVYSVVDGVETLELKLTEHISTFLTLRPLITIRQERRGSRESQYEN